jgi:hypothetical protein
MHSLADNSCDEMQVATGKYPASRTTFVITGVDISGLTAPKPPLAATGTNVTVLSVWTTTTS